MPAEVARYGTGGGSLAVGSPGKVGVLELTFERARPDRPPAHGARAPLPEVAAADHAAAVLRRGPPRHPVHVPDDDRRRGAARRPAADRPRVRAGHRRRTSPRRRTRSCTGWSTATRRRSSTSTSPPTPTSSTCPDPVIPFAGARFYQRTRVTLARVGDAAVRRDVVRRPAVARRAQRVRRVRHRPRGPAARRHAARGRPGAAGPRRRPARRAGRARRSRHRRPRCTCSPRRTAASALADRLHAALQGCVVDDTHVGVSVLPGDAGAWVRMVGDDTVTMTDLFRHAWGTRRGRC